MGWESWWTGIGDGDMARGTAVLGNPAWAMRLTALRYLTKAMSPVCHKGRDGHWRGFEPRESVICRGPFRIIWL